MAVEPVRLHPDDLAAVADAVARRIAGLLREEPLRPAARLLTADEVAERVGRSRDFVYDHAAALGGSGWVMARGRGSRLTRRRSRPG